MTEETWRFHEIRRGPYAGYTMFTFRVDQGIDKAPFFIRLGAPSFFTDRVLQCNLANWWIA